MSTIQKAITEIRALLDNELDMVGGLAGRYCTVAREHESWCYVVMCAPSPAPPGTCFSVPADHEVWFTYDTVEC